jgi:hypothetical protein
MRTTLLALAALAAVAATPCPAAEVQAGLRLVLPDLPRLVVIQPGVQVVQDFDDEVFLHGGVYWARRSDRWYRSHDRRAQFVVVETRLVPEPLRRLPAGRYRHYRPPPPPPVRHQRVLQVEEKEDKKEEKRRRKEEDRARKEHEHEHDGKHDHGKGH